MTTSTMLRRHALAAVLPLALACATVHAQQQTPITGQMLAPTAPAARNDATAASVSVPAPAPTTAPTTTPVAQVADARPTEDSTQVGDVTHQLFAMQAQGTQAGRHLSIPGQEASASYQRYLKSFEHPIPEFYETAVNNGKGSASSDSSGMP